VVEDRGNSINQADGGVHFEWGPPGAVRAVDRAGCLVVVDVLSFTTAVTVATSRGIAVLPYRFGDAAAAGFAQSHQAQLAVPRKEMSGTRPWSLSPAVLADAPVTPRLVLPSPNGSAIAAACRDAVVVAACLRNAAAVARWIIRSGYGSARRRAVVVAAGERWPDGSLRPALEDALGAGAVLHHLQKAGCRLSAEAQANAAMFDAVSDIGDAVRSCLSGRQLIGAGYLEDVEAATATERDPCVPVLVDGAFTNAVSPP
jgi:2-phosphosulfolactate phosphatase